MFPNFDQRFDLFIQQAIVLANEQKSLNTSTRITHLKVRR